jgi:hypothetical protein
VPWPSIFSIVLFGSTTLLTGMTSFSLHMQWPLTSQSLGSVSQREQLVFHYGSNSYQVQRPVLRKPSQGQGDQMSWWKNSPKCIPIISFAKINTFGEKVAPISGYLSHFSKTDQSKQSPIGRKFAFRSIWLPWLRRRCQCKGSPNQTGLFRNVVHFLHL